MSHHFIVCETSEKKFIKRVYDTEEECHQYFENILKEINLRPGNYHILSQTENELIVEEMGEEGAVEGSRRAYTIVEGEIADVMNSLLGQKDEGKQGLL